MGPQRSPSPSCLPPAAPYLLRCGVGCCRVPDVEGSGFDADVLTSCELLHHPFRTASLLEPTVEKSIGYMAPHISNRVSCSYYYICTNLFTIPAFVCDEAECVRCSPGGGGGVRRKWTGGGPFAEEFCVGASLLWNVVLCPNMPTLLAAAVTPNAGASC